jgi:trehalose 6-phosphate phosphatase
MLAVTDLARRLGERISSGGRVWLFLDYDGTLADFAPTPDDILPDPVLLTLLRELTEYPDRLKVIILSGRRLSHILELVPLENIVAAGSYGVEVRDAGGQTVSRVDQAAQRPVLDQIKNQWQALIDNKTGFYLEDKGYSIALHARFAAEDQAQPVIDWATEAAEPVVDRASLKILGGERFVEVAPQAAGKGEAVTHLLKTLGRQDEEPVIFIGDDDKDEAAFAVVRQLGGMAIVVSTEERPTSALYRLENPQAVRCWLAELAASIDTI